MVAEPTSLAMKWHERIDYVFVLAVLIILIVAIKVA